MNVSDRYCSLFREMKMRFPNVIPQIRENSNAMQIRIRLSRSSPFSGNRMASLPFAYSTTRLPFLRFSYCTLIHL